jgi:MraZ protein
VELDKQGRILIPQTLRESAALDGQTVLSGRRECLEIWSADAWKQEMNVVQREYAANLEAQEGLNT